MPRHEDFSIPKVERPLTSPMVKELARQYEILTTWHIWGMASAWISFALGFTFGRILFLSISAAIVSLFVVSGNKLLVRRSIVEEGRDTEEMTRADDKRLGTWSWVIPIVAIVGGWVFYNVAIRTFAIDHSRGY